jgi:hypothetical protein
VKILEQGSFYSMKVEVGSFARQGLEARVGPDLPAAINAALVYYVGKLSSGRVPEPYPSFLGGGAEAGPGDDEFLLRRVDGLVEVPVDERIEAAVDTEARRQQVGVAALAGHAVMVFLAELDLIGDPTQAGAEQQARV